ncbi:MAG: hypothetical protein K5778_09055 [Bacteroidaceae bacterium]|nr:hypothetical protein [Bacteroidaceae bacterium]
MNKSNLFILAGIFLFSTLCSCQGRVTVQGENGTTDTIEFNTDTIRHLNISIQVGDAAQQDAASSDVESVQPSDSL